MGRAHFRNEELSVAPIAVLLLIIHNSLTPMIIVPTFQTNWTVAKETVYSPGEIPPRAVIWDL